ncbi:hypothetical protein TWF718_006335 [Orbilia javanica]|uniref:Uncharacterized protein n=1 Tax=Orbilia javanica TaxID=47235 RepID=A0AAN8N0J0_9PEZI
MDSDIPPPSIDEPNQILLRGPSISSDPVAPDALPAESGSGVSVEQTTTATTTTSERERPTAAAPGGGSSGDDIVPQPLQKRRTSSFEYHEDGPSQYDSLKLASRGPNALSPLFIDLLRGKIREAERQLHFALLSTSTRDSHDASKRCSCALAELDYVRQRVILPPPIQLLDARVLRSTALATIQHASVGEDRVLDAKKAENLIERAFQVLGELVDWEEVKKRGAAVEMLEEFLPMCYFGKDGDGKALPDQTASKETADGEGEEGTVDFTETMVLWYQMMVDHAKITVVKTEMKKSAYGKEIKVENLAKAGRLFAVALEGMKEIYEAEDGVDTEYVDYKKNAEDGLQKIADIAVRVGKQDELVDIMESTTPKLDMENVKLKVIIAMRKALEEKNKKREQLGGESYADRPPKTPANDDEAPDDEEGGSRNKGKGRATDAEEELTPLSPKPISAKEKGKGKAIILEDEEKERGLPAYTPCTEIPNTGQKEDDWVIVEPKE